MICISVTCEKRWLHHYMGGEQGRSSRASGGEFKQKKPDIYIYLKPLGPLGHLEKTVLIWILLNKVITHDT